MSEGKDNRAAQFLRSRFDGKRGEQKAMARRTGVSQAQLSRLAAGMGALPTVVTIERLVPEGVERHWWGEPPRPEPSAGAAGAGHA